MQRVRRFSVAGPGEPCRFHRVGTVGVGPGRSWRPLILHPPSPERRSAWSRCNSWPMPRRTSTRPGCRWRCPWAGTSSSPASGSPSPCSPFSRSGGGTSGATRTCTNLAHTWAKAMGVLFAAGAVSGTLLSFEMGILWPGLMEPLRRDLRLPVRAGGIRLLHRGDLRGHLPVRLEPPVTAGAHAERAADDHLGRGGCLLRRRGERLDEQPDRVPAGRRRAGRRRRSRGWRCSGRPPGRRPCTCCSRPTWSPASRSPPSTRSGCSAVAATAATGSAC